MNITVLHGQMHHGSTYHITAQLLSKLPNAQITQFFFPRDMPHYCVGCFQCFSAGETLCPHAEAVMPIVAAMDACDLLVIETPCYVFNMTAQLKAFLDHLGYRWMVHRPSPAMFRKSAVLITTAAGGGTGDVIRTLRTNLNYWGISRIHALGINVAAASWAGVSDQKKAEIEKKTTALARRVSRQTSREQPSVKVRGLFYVMRMLHKGNTFSARDHEHWQRMGWLDQERPWTN